MLAWLLVLQFAAANPAVSDSASLKRATVLDAGHGGNDSGRVFHAKVDGTWVRMREKTYSCDIVARSLVFLRKRGEEVGTTTRGSCILKPHDFTFSPRPYGYDEFFRTTGERVGNSHFELLQRDIFAERFFAEHPARDSLFISVHVNYDDDNLSPGAFIIVPEKCPVPRIALKLARILKRERLAKEFSDRELPIVINGEKGYRRVEILTETPTCEAGLLEVENLFTKIGRRRLRSPDMRDRYAHIIDEAILTS